MKGPVFDKEPCDKCKEFMKQGIILIEVRDGESGENPYRTGGWWVVTEEVVRRILHPEQLVQDVLKRRVACIPQEAANLIGLRQGVAK